MNSYFFKLGFFGIKWYSVIMLMSIVVALFLIIKETKKEDIDSSFISDLAFYGIIVGIIGARTYYVIFNWNYYGSHFFDIFKIWEGGLAIHGAMIAGSIFIIFYSLIKKYHPIKIIDITVVGLILGQVIGRWGNFMNSEAYGAITTKAALIKQKIPNFVIKGMHIDGAYYQPTFWYESIWNLIGFIILISMRYFGKLKIGTLTCFYLFWYGFGRLIIEQYRSDSLSFMGIKVAQIVSLTMILGSIIGYIIIRNRPRLYYKNELNQEAA